MSRMGRWALTLPFPTALVAVAAIFLWPGLVGPGYDAAIFTTIAFRIRAGDMPYRDVWEHKPPGIFLADASIQSLFPWLDPWTPVWLLSVVCAAALGLVVAVALRTNGHPKLAPWCGLATTATVAAFPISYGGGQSELVAAVPAAIAVVALSRRPGQALTFACGVLLGLAFSTSWHLTPALVVALALVLYGTDRWRRSFLLVSGISVVGAAIAAWLILGGAWSDAIDALVTFNLVYRAANLVDPIVKFSPSAAAAFLAVAALLGLIAMTRRPPRAIFVVAAAWVGLSIVMFAAEGRLGAHYLASIVIPLGILAGPGLALVAPRSSRGISTAGPLIAQLVLVSAVAVSGFSTVYWTQALGEIYVARASSLHEAANWLRSLDCAETLLVWGHAPEIYYVSGLRPASRYVSLPALMTEGWATADRVQDVANEINSLRPAAVIDASSWGGSLVTFPLLERGSFTTHDGRYVDNLDPIRDIVRARYVFSRDVAEWPTYVLADERTSLPATSNSTQQPILGSATCSGRRASPASGAER